MLRMLVLCAVVFSLSGCSDRVNVEEKVEVTLQEGFKGTIHYDGFVKNVIDSSGGLVSSVDIFDNEIVLIAQNASFDDVAVSIKDNVENNKKDIVDNLISSGVFEEMSEIVEDYTGDTVITYI